MDLEDFQFLLDAEGQHILDELNQESLEGGEHLAVAQRLSERIGPRRTHAVLETVMLRRRAATKFTLAAKMYFTRTALQQASAEVISAYRARRYQSAGLDQIADLGCGIGGDSLALAAIADVTGVDWHPVRLAMAQENVTLYGRGERFHPLQADLLELSPLPVDALFADPGRRDDYGRRLYSIHQYKPPLSFLDPWRERIPHQGIKIGPGVDYDELPAEAEVEFISVRGEVREGVLWFGDLRSGANRRATLLPGAHTLVDDAFGAIPVVTPKTYLYEPDGAVIRAHLVEQLADQIGASKIDGDIAYLTADQKLETPFARRYALEGYFPFQLKRLRRYLRERNVGVLTIKKRGSALDPDQLRRRLRLTGDEHRVIFLTRVLGAPAVLVGYGQVGANELS